MTLAAQVLNTASETITTQSATQPGSRPEPGQWFYSKSVSYTYGQGTTTSDSWIRFDGAQDAYLENGKLTVHTAPAIGGSAGGTPLSRFAANTTPMTAYDALASLPADPARLLATVDQELAMPGQTPAHTMWSQAVTSREQREFAYLADLLWNATAGSPATAQAAVFRAMADLAGITVQDGVTNAAGSPALGVSANDGVTQLLLDPKTYRVVGERQVSTGADPAAAAVASGGKTGGDKTRLWPAKGDVVESLALSQVVMVSEPGGR
jgi:hypothetical protein